MEDQLNNNQVEKDLYLMSKIILIVGFVIVFILLGVGGYLMFNGRNEDGPIGLCIFVGALAMVPFLIAQISRLRILVHISINLKEITKRLQQK